MTHIDAGVIGQNAIVGQCHVLLLPLLVQRAAAALQQEALTKTKEEEGEFNGQVFILSSLLRPETEQDQELYSHRERPNDRDHNTSSPHRRAITH